MKKTYIQPQIKILACKHILLAGSPAPEVKTDTESAGGSGTESGGYWYDNGNAM